MEFVDPQELHKSFPYTDLRSSYFIGASLESRYDEVDSTKKLHDSPFLISDTPKKTMEDNIGNSLYQEAFSDDWALSPTMTLIPTSNVDGGDYTASHGDTDHSTTNFGFAIKSGWSSTFLS